MAQATFRKLLYPNPLLARFRPHFCPAPLPRKFPVPGCSVTPKPIPRLQHAVTLSIPIDAARASTFVIPIQNVLISLAR
jgi:hypothetical protein